MSAYWSCELELHDYLYIYNITINWISNKNLINGPTIRTEKLTVFSWMIGTVMLWWDENWEVYPFPMYRIIKHKRNRPYKLLVNLFIFPMSCHRVTVENVSTLRTKISGTMLVYGGNFSWPSLYYWQVAILWWLVRQSPQHKLPCTAKHSCVSQRVRWCGATNVEVWYYAHMFFTPASFVYNLAPALSLFLFSSPSVPLCPTQFHFLDQSHVYYTRRLHCNTQLCASVAVQ